MVERPLWVDNLETSLAILSKILLTNEFIIIFKSWDRINFIEYFIRYDYGTDGLFEDTYLCANTSKMYKTPAFFKAIFLYYHDILFIFYNLNKCSNNALVLLIPLDLV